MAGATCDILERVGQFKRASCKINIKIHTFFVATAALEASKKSTVACGVAASRQGCREGVVVDASRVDRIRKQTQKKCHFHW